MNTTTTAATAPARLPVGHADPSSPFYVPDGLRPFYVPQHPDQLAELRHSPIGQQWLSLHYQRKAQQLAEQDPARLDPRAGGPQLLDLTRQLRQQHGWDAEARALFDHAQALAEAQREWQLTVPRQQAQQQWDAAHTCVACRHVRADVARRELPARPPAALCVPCLTVAQAELARRAERERLDGRTRQQLVTNWLGQA